MFIECKLHDLIKNLLLYCSDPMHISEYIQGLEEIKWKDWKKMQKISQVYKITLELGKTNDE